MENTNTMDSEIIDLGFDVTEADVARPILKDGTYKSSIQGVKQVTSSGGHDMLQVNFRLEEDVEDTAGKKVNPGFTLVQRYMMKPVGKMTQEMVNDNFKRLHFAASGAGRVNTGDWVGKQVRIRVKIREAGTDPKTGKQFNESNDVAGVYPAAK